MEYLNACFMKEELEFLSGPLIFTAEYTLLNLAIKVKGQWMVALKNVVQMWRAASLHTHIRGYERFIADITRLSGNAVHAPTQV